MKGGVFDKYPRIRKIAFKQTTQHERETLGVEDPIWLSGSNEDQSQI